MISNEEVVPKLKLVEVYSSIRMSNKYSSALVEAIIDDVLKLVSAGSVSVGKMLVYAVTEANKPAIRSIVRSKIGCVKILTETQT